MQKIVIFGASLGGERGFRSLRYRQKAVAFSDNDQRKHGTQFQGLPVVSPSELSKLKYDTILIASSYYSEIFEQLVGLGVPADRIDILDHDLLEGREEPSPISDFAIAGLGVVITGTLIFAVIGCYHLFVF